MLRARCASTSALDLLDRDYGMEPSPATEELVADIKLGAFERPATRLGAQPEFDMRMLRMVPDRSISPEANTSMRRPRCAWCCGHLRCTASAAIVPIWCRVLPASAACLVRFREWSVVDRPPATIALSLPDSAPQYCIETTAYQAGPEINIVMVLRDDATASMSGAKAFGSTSITGSRRSSASSADRDVAKRTVIGERLMRLAGEPDVSLDLHDRWLRGRIS